MPFSKLQFAFWKLTTMIINSVRQRGADAIIILLLMLMLVVTPVVNDDDDDDDAVAAVE